MDIRVATIDDTADILNIYKPYIEKTAITFEYDVPTEEEFRGRIEETLKKYPYLVAIEDGKIVGYAYASQFHTRRAFVHGAELSVYVDWDYRGKGIGSKLYDEIISILLKQNVLIAYACIARTSDENDPYLTNASIDFHAKLGFKLTGEHVNSGYKFNRFYDVVWMEKIVAEDMSNPKEFVEFNKNMEGKK